jgi:hypothetical protein
VRRVIGLLVVLLGIGGIVASVMWRSRVIPELVRYPTDLDVTQQLEGTFTTFLDPATASPLPAPTEVRLTIDRHITSEPHPDDDGLVVVNETLTINAGGVDTEQEHRYVMDRTTNVNLADDLAFAFDEDNVVDRSGAYRLNLPFDMRRDRGYPIYKNEYEITYEATPAEVTEDIAGVDLAALEGIGGPHPLSEAYFEALDDVVNLPSSLTIDQLRPLLGQRGVDVDRTVLALLAVATQEELAELGTLLDAPIPMQYLGSFQGSELLDVDTGAVVDVVSVVEDVFAAPEPDSLPPLLAILERYTDQPDVAAAVEGFQSFLDDPVPVFRNEFSQTPESITDVADQVSDQRRRIDLAERTVPMILMVAGGAVSLLGLFLLFAPRRAPKLAPIDLDAPIERPDDVGVTRL